MKDRKGKYHYYKGSPSPPRNISSLTNNNHGIGQIQIGIPYEEQDQLLMY